MIHAVYMQHNVYMGLGASIYVYSVAASRVCFVRTDDKCAIIIIIEFTMLSIPSFFHALGHCGVNTYTFDRSEHCLFTGFD